MSRSLWRLSEIFADAIFAALAQRTAMTRFEYDLLIRDALIAFEIVLQREIERRDHDALEHGEE